MYKYFLSMDLDGQSLFAIGAVERDTGISRDTLRIWERRYGFLTLARNAEGERVYSAEQIRRLQVIRRLLDQGLRPGKVVALSEAALDALDGTQPQISARASVAVAESTPVFAPCTPRTLVHRPSAPRRATQVAECH